MTQHPNVSISQITASSAATFNMSASSVTQSPNIYISQNNQQVPTTDTQSLSHSSASLLVANTLVSLISQVLSQYNPSPQLSASSSLSTSVIDPNYLFWVVLLSGNISHCQGCLGKILRSSDGKVLPPPDDLVLQHKEQVLFNNPKTGMCQLSRDYRNVYYHARLSCVKQKFPAFQPGQHEGEQWHFLQAYQCAQRLHNKGIWHKVL